MARFLTNLRARIAYRAGKKIAFHDGEDGVVLVPGVLEKGSFRVFLVGMVLLLLHVLSFNESSWSRDLTLLSGHTLIAWCLVLLWVRPLVKEMHHSPQPLRWVDQHTFLHAFLGTAILLFVLR